MEGWDGKQTESATAPDDAGARRTFFWLRWGIVGRQKVMRTDARKEWQRFLAQKQKQHRRSRFRKAVVWTAAAACVLFAAWLWYPRSSRSSEMLFMATPHPGAVSLHTPEGRTVTLPVRCDAHTMDSLLKVCHVKPTESVIVTTPSKRDCQLTLADGSQVWLNAGSRMEYEPVFRQERRIRLRGEAYFQVARDAERPFIVETEFMHTRVYGTSFNVRCYSAADAHVTLVEGSVQVARPDGSRSVRLTPGMDAQLTADGGLSVSAVDTKNFVLWKDGYFYFDDVPLSEILCELGRWYNVSVQVENRDVCRSRLHFLASRHASLQEAVDLLNLLGVARVELQDGYIIVR